MKCKAELLSPTVNKKKTGDKNLPSGLYFSKMHSTETLGSGPAAWPKLALGHEVRANAIQPPG